MYDASYHEYVVRNLNRNLSRLNSDLRICEVNLSRARELEIRQLEKQLRLRIEDLSSRIAALEGAKAMITPSK